MRPERERELAVAIVEVTALTVEAEPRDPTAPVADEEAETIDEAEIRVALPLVADPFPLPPVEPVGMLVERGVERVCRRLPVPEAFGEVREDHGRPLVRARHVGHDDPPRPIDVLVGRVLAAHQAREPVEQSRRERLWGIDVVRV